MCVRLDAEFRQFVDDFARLKADRDDLCDEADDVLRVVGAVRVVGDAAAAVGADLVLVNDPFERRAVAEPILEGLGRDAVEREEVVVLECAPVPAQLHPLDAPVERGRPVLDSFERVFRLPLVVDVDFGEPRARLGEGAEVRRERDAR